MALTTDSETRHAPSQARTRAATGTAREEPTPSAPPSGAGAGQRDRSAINQTCELCGDRARVQVLEGYAANVSVRRHLCLSCARTHLPPPFVAPQAKKRLGGLFLLVLTGVGLGIWGIFGDILGPAGHPGFGWYQRIGIGVGALIVVAGALLQVEIVALTGACFFIGALFVDVLGLPPTPGIGWKQQVLIGISVACVAGALLGRLVSPLLARRARRSSAAPGVLTRCCEQLGAVLESERLAER